MGQNAYIQLLQRQIDAATDLDLADLARWRIRAESAIRYTVGEASPALKKFRTVTYEPTGVAFGAAPGTDQQDALEAAQRAGVNAAVVYLKFAIYELEVWDELQVLKGTSVAAPTESSTRQQLPSGRQDNR